jgi:hypothetical protein
MPYACKYILEDLTPLLNNCIRAIHGAYSATPISNMEVKVGILWLGIHLDRILAQFSVRLEELE